MSVVCHETGECVENPYYSMMVVLRDPKNGKIAYSNMEVSLSALAFKRVERKLSTDLSDIVFGYAIETKTGEIGGFNGTVQLSGSSKGHEDHRYLREDIAFKNLPKSARDLKIKIEWIERLNGEWVEAKWAEEVYKQTKAYRTSVSCN